MSSSTSGQIKPATHRGLFKQLLGAVIIIGITGLVSTFFYYDFS